MRKGWTGAKKKKKRYERRRRRLNDRRPPDGHRRAQRRGGGFLEESIIWRSCSARVIVITVQHRTIGEHDDPFLFFFFRFFSPLVNTSHHVRIIIPYLWCSCIDALRDSFWFVFCNVRSRTHRRTRDLCARCCSAMRVFLCTCAGCGFRRDGKKKGYKTVRVREHNGTRVYIYRDHVLTTVGDLFTTRRTLSISRAARATLSRARGPLVNYSKRPRHTYDTTLTLYSFPFFFFFFNLSFLFFFFIRLGICSLFFLFFVRPPFGPRTNWIRTGLGRIVIVMSLHALYVGRTTATITHRSMRSDSSAAVAPGFHGPLYVGINTHIYCTFTFAFSESCVFLRFCLAPRWHDKPFWLLVPLQKRRFFFFSYTHLFVPD